MAQQSTQSDTAQQSTQSDTAQHSTQSDKAQHSTAHRVTVQCSTAHNVIVSSYLKIACRRLGAEQHTRLGCCWWLWLSGCTSGARRSTRPARSRPLLQDLRRQKKSDEIRRLGSSIGQHGMMRHCMIRNSLVWCAALRFSLLFSPFLSSSMLCFTLLCSSLSAVRCDLQSSSQYWSQSQSQFSVT
jgi:hypothetical protein